jgi:hypothetical protein
MIRPLVLLAALVVSPSTALAATYHVATTGNDTTGDGSVGNPWRTIQKCAQTEAVAGDLCSIGSGTFTEVLDISNDGALGSRISIVGQSDLSTVIAGRVLITGDYITFEDITVNMADGTLIGINLNGIAGIVNNVDVMTTSTALGTNVVGVQYGGLGQGNTLSNSVVRAGCYGIILFGDADSASGGHIIDGNELTEMRADSASCGDIDYMRIFGDNHTIRNNRLHGIDRDLSPEAHVDCFQTFDNNGLDRAIENMLVENNFCSDASQGVHFEGTFFLASTNVIFRNNVFTRTTAWCALFRNIEDVHFLNNVCDISSGSSGPYCRGTSYTTCEFKNNIIYGDAANYGVTDTAVLIDGAAGEPGENNLLYDPGTTITGYADDLINVDPLFVDADGDDYRLSGASPARDAGQAIGSWATPTDLLGILRPQGGGWDIGAYEYEVVAGLVRARKRP